MKLKTGWITRWLLLAMLTAFPALAQAQFYNGMNMEFGKNRVQWKDFHWSYYRYETFDVYYYQGGVEFANYVLNYAKDAIPTMEKKFGAHFGKKVQFLVFNSLGDLKQSNLNNNEEDTGNTGGVTKIIGSKIFLYFNGNYIDFEQQIKEGLAQLLLIQTMNGVSIGSQIRSSYRYDIPEWFQNGLCAYLTDNWDSYREDQLQRGILSGRFKKINQLRDQDAVIAGYSFWGFIEERYGSKAFSDIVTLAENSMNVKKALLYVTGVKYKELIKQWFQFYEERYKMMRQDLPTEVMALNYRKYRTFTEPEVSPDGKRIAYVSNDEGRIGIYVEELASGKRERVYKTGYRSDTWIDTSLPILAWHPTGGILSFIIEEEGQLLLCNLDLGTKKVGKTFLFEFQKVTSLAHAHRERKVVLSATRHGKPDIYVYNLFSNTLEQITDDYYTDLSPVFSYDDRQILFSSNRIDESLETQDKPGVQQKHFNLYSYDYRNKAKRLRNLTGQQVSSNTLPKSYPGNKLFFLNDSSGYYNLYEALFDSVVSHIDTIVHYRYFTVTKPLTSFSSSIIDYSYNPLNRNFHILLHDQDGQKVYVTPYRADQEAGIRQMNPYAQQRLLKKRLSEQALLEKTTSHRFKNSYRPTQKKATSGGVAVSPDIATSKPRKDTVLRAQNYYVGLFTDEITSQIDFSYLNYSYQPFTGYVGAVYQNSGVNFFMGAKMADLMEDYKIEAGVKLNTSLVNNEYVIRFNDLSKRVDKSLTLHRYVTDYYPDSYNKCNIYTNEAFYTLSYPFNETLSLRGTGIFRMDKWVSLATTYQGLIEGNAYEQLAGLKAELVYDNSKKIETNLYVGARGKVFAEYYQTLAKQTNNFIVVGFDYRHYTRIHRNFIWANRIAGSSSFGQQKLLYYMGGVDNWILPDFNYETPIDFSQPYRYQTLATNMRGFSQNIRNGSNFVVFNSELRLPLFSYLFNTPINIGFIRNFQLVAFGDLGTAWNGWNPYDPSNSLYTSHYHDGNLDISVTELKNPIVGGVGLGLRTTLLGYFIRGDMAWGIEDGNLTKKPKFYLSFGLDF